MKSLAVFLLLFSIMEKYSPCPSDWTAFNNRCFRFVADAKTWAGAEKNCMSLGGNLASVHSKEDYHQIQTLIFKASRKPSITWIGGSDAQESKIWLWSDGTPMTYTNWCPGQPNGFFRQKCIQMNYSSKRKCHTTCFFSCYDRVVINVCMSLGNNVDEQAGIFH
uniref:C-type lectin domain-containing protein n=1 Tax=Xiphophorus couchianus TaxID=32473 RepID=A0A3B5LQL2_9TELE